MFNNVAGTGSAFPQNKPIGVDTASPSLPDVPADLNFKDAEAVREMHHRLAQSPAMQAWCEQIFDGVDHDRVCAAVASLRLHQHAAARHQVADAIPERSWDAYETLAKHLSPASTAALRQTLDADGVPRGFSDYLADPDWLHVFVALCYRDGDAHMDAGSWAQAALDYTMGARASEQVAGYAWSVLDLYEKAAVCHKEANELAQAAAINMICGMRRFESVLSKTSTDPDTAFCREVHSDSLSYAERSLELGRDFYIQSGQPQLAIDAALELECVSTYKSSVENSIKDPLAEFNAGTGWTLIAAAHRQAGRTERANDADARAKAAYARAGAGFEKEEEWEGAVNAYEALNQHDKLAMCYEKLTEALLREAKFTWRDSAIKLTRMAAEITPRAQVSHGHAAEQAMTQARDLATQGQHAKAAPLFSKAADHFKGAKQPEQATEAAQAAQRAKLQASFGTPPSQGVIDATNAIIAMWMDDPRLTSGEGYPVGECHYHLAGGVDGVSKQAFVPGATDEWCVIFRNPARTAADLVRATSVVEMIAGGNQDLVLKPELSAATLLRGPALLAQLRPQPSVQPEGAGGEGGEQGGQPPHAAT